MEIEKCYNLLMDLRERRKIISEIINVLEDWNENYILDDLSRLMDNQHFKDVYKDIIQMKTFNQKAILDLMQYIFEQENKQAKNI